MSVGDINSDQQGSGARYNDGKPDWSLLPLHLLEGSVRVWMYGAKKYAAWNWAKGMAWSVAYACAMRHLIAWYRGEDNDPETGQSHLDHVICNILMLKHFEENYEEGDDRPKMFGMREAKGEDQGGEGGLAQHNAEDGGKVEYRLTQDLAGNWVYEPVPNNEFKGG